MKKLTDADIENFKYRLHRVALNAWYLQEALNQGNSEPKAEQEALNESLQSLCDDFQPSDYSRWRQTGAFLQAIVKANPKPWKKKARVKAA